MTNITVLCAACKKTVEDCRCEDLPETESHWHETNRWAEEVLRFLRTWGMIK